MSQVTVAEPRLGLENQARAILDALPAWFGIPEANEEYIQFVASHPTWSACDGDGRVVGVLAPLDHDQSSEIYLLAVLPDMHRLGVGRALVDAFEQAAAARGVALTQVKTLGPSHPDEGYAATRQFYAALGYLALEETLDLWDGMPALIMVKPLPRPGGEARVIASTAGPVTRSDLVAALHDAGVRRGAVVMVHASLSSLGWVVGDTQTVVLALVDAVGADGTIVMPAQTGFSDPARWQDPPVPPSWCDVIRSAMPAFDPALSSLRGMGGVVETFRRLPGVVHSGHPTVGFLAAGPRAAEIVTGHPLAMGLDDASPLGRLYDLDATVVLLGVGHDRNTSLHLAEHRAAYRGKRTIRDGVALTVDGERRWVEFDDLDRDTHDDFAEIGAAYLAAGGRHGSASIGNGSIDTFPTRALVDFAVEWMQRYRAEP